MAPISTPTKISALQLPVERQHGLNAYTSNTKLIISKESVEMKRTHSWSSGLILATSFLSTLSRLVLIKNYEEVVEKKKVHLSGSLIGIIFGFIGFQCLLGFFFCN